MGIKAQKRKPITGIQGIVGEIGEVNQDLRPDGAVKVHGEIWNATSLDGLLRRGTKVKVEEIENLKLKVRKLEP
jgi:membrane-bound serine protease (ClpP class)